MRLRRIIEHVRGQNWVAVALDLAITVIGVFIGIQVANWNADRQDRQRAHQVLVELSNEFKGFDRAAASLADFYDGSLKNQQVLLASLRAGQVRPDDRDKVRDAVALGLLYGDPPPPSGTYRDLLSSGKLDLIRDQQLRIKLVEYDQSIDVVARSDNNIQLGLVSFYHAFARPMVSSSTYALPSFTKDDYFVDAKTDFANVVVDIPKLLADPEFRVSAEQVFMAQQYRLVNIRISQGKIAKVRQLIERDLKRGD
ncbi:hypothetical protein [Sphingomonas sp.]|uniref:hypothetical protein n=1 Tax=Sphingomonas sp. TaxID=28214 RepID=UPI00286CD945|nr:hypothetical protein [Sphingomonas sp.]